MTAQPYDFFSCLLFKQTKPGYRLPELCLQFGLLVLQAMLEADDGIRNHDLLLAREAIQALKHIALSVFFSFFFLFTAICSGFLPDNFSPFLIACSCFGVESYGAKTTAARS